MGNKGGGGGRVGFGTLSNKGPKNLGGRHGAGGRGRGGGGGGTFAALSRAAGGDPLGKSFTLASFQRQARLNQADALAEADRLVASGHAEFTFLGAKTAQILRNNGRNVVERDGKPVKGFKVIQNLA